MVYSLSQSLSTRILTHSEHKALLAHVSIHSVTDILLLDYSKLKLIAQNTSIDFGKLIELRDLYINLFLDESYHVKQNHKSATISCSSHRINTILNGKYSQNIIEICGSLTSGKSQLAWSFALDSALAGTKVIFVDVDLSFSKNRTMQIVRSSRNYSEAKFQSLMNSLFIIEMFNLESLINLLEHIVLNVTLHNSLLIIDSISSILFALNDINKKELSKQRKFTKCELHQILKWATHKANMATIVTRLSPNEHIPWPSADINIRLDKGNNDTVKVMVTDQTIFQLSSVDQFKDIVIRVTDAGIVDV